MKTQKRTAALLAALGITLGAGIAVTGFGAQTKQAAPSAALMASFRKDDKPTPKVAKAEDEWRKLLSPETFDVTREAGTEAPFHNAYWNNHEKGIYKCADCGLTLFKTDTKFDSGTGWPSFWAPVDKSHLANASDTTLGMERTEVRCARCNAHLGHVFDDGPKPTGLRYCMNSAAMIFVKTP